MRLILDMQTRDPDDALMLCLVATHPDVELLAVCLNPGTPAQIGVVRELLRRLGREVPVGARNPDSPSDAVSPFHAAWLGTVAPEDPDAVAHRLMASVLASHPDAVLLTGAPLHNLRRGRPHRMRIDVTGLRDCAIAGGINAVSLLLFYVGLRRGKMEPDPSGRLRRHRSHESTTPERFKQWLTA